MDVTPPNAQAALADIEAAHNRSARLRGYQSVAPHLIIWGIAWTLGYTVTDLAPGWVNVAWLAIGAIGTLAGFAVPRLDRPQGGQNALAGAFSVIILAFIAGTLAVMRPGDPRQVGAFIPLVAAAGFAIIGVLGAPRLLVLGGSVAVLTLGGFFALPAHFLLWMAAIGGGSLILGGVWLRRA